MQLAGRNAIVTGAAQGIGASIAQRFAAAGATCVVADLEEASIREAAERIPSAVPVALSSTT